MQEERRSLIEYLYSGKFNGELFFDELREMKYHIEEAYGDPLNLGSITAFIRYENGKTKFLNVSNHINDLEVITQSSSRQAA